MSIHFMRTAGHLQNDRDFAFEWPYLDLNVKIEEASYLKSNLLGQVVFSKDLKNKVCSDPRAIALKYSVFTRVEIII